MKRLFVLVLALAGVSAGALNLSSALAAPPTAKPGVNTQPATAVNMHSATLNGVVDPNGLATTYKFQYGKTTTYGTTTPIKPATGSGKHISVSATVSNLASGTTYHYRLVATNSKGTTLGGDKQFTTAASTKPPSRIALFGHTAFVSPTHVFGVFVGCIGPSQCTGSMKVTHNGTVIGQRSAFFVASNDGGIVHLTLNHAGRVALSHAPNHHLAATVTVKGLNGTTGNSSKNVTIVPFS
jgi:hypothetical protein